MLATLAKTTIACLALAAGLLAADSASADQFERWIDISNNHYADIVRVQISNIHSDVWGANLLRGEIIHSGGYMTVEPRFSNGYCRYDIMITFSGGEKLPIWDVNLCEATDIITDGYNYDVYYI